MTSRGQKMTTLALGNKRTKSPENVLCENSFDIKSK